MGTVVDLRPKCVLRLTVHLCDPETPDARDVEIWQSAPVVLADGLAPDPLRFVVRSLDRPDPVMWLFVLDGVDKPEDGPWVARYHPYAVIKGNPLTGFLQQVGFRLWLQAAGATPLPQVPEIRC